MPSTGSVPYRGSVGQIKSQPLLPCTVSFRGGKGVLARTLPLSMGQTMNKKEKKIVEVQTFCRRMREFLSIHGIEAETV
jgi:hypothetical protein